MKDWCAYARESDGLKIRVGRWNILGSPITILVDFTPFYAQKNDIYGQAWCDFQVDSLHAYGDYDEASMFAYAAGKVVESFYRHCLSKKDRVVYHANEWMTGLGALYLRKHVPEIATILLLMQLLSDARLPETTNLCMTICLHIMATRWLVN